VNAPFFDRTITRKEGSLVLRDPSGLVVDSLNYGALVDPWAAEGYQALSGREQGGCFAPAPGSAGGQGPFDSTVGATNQSAGRFPDGADTDSNCSDFLVQTAITLPVASPAGATNIKVGSVAGFVAGHTIRIDAGADLETAVIATVGSAGATTVRTATGVGDTVIPVASVTGFSEGQTVSIGSGANSETAVLAPVAWWDRTITVTSPLTHAHEAGAQVSGTGITLNAPLTRSHSRGTQVTDNDPTPGAPNRYYTGPR
jgi:hypothetical protein